MMNMQESKRMMGRKMAEMLSQSTSTDTKTTKRGDTEGTVLITKNKLEQLAYVVCVLADQHLRLIDLYEQESALKKSQRAYLHIRELAEEACRVDQELVPALVLDAFDLNCDGFSGSSKELMNVSEELEDHPKADDSASLTVQDLKELLMVAAHMMRLLDLGIHGTAIQKKEAIDVIEDSTLVCSAVLGKLQRQGVV